MEKENRYAKFIDEDFPLLHKLKTEAPGTYKHSKNVADICVSVASELGLDKELMQCAALYHDVGKIFNPIWFTENQTEESLHENASPEYSYQIISRHVADSVLLLAQYEFPQEVIKIVSCHHGSSVVVYFWKKCGGNEEDKNKYRYNSEKPQDVYSNILMMCDRVEATARSLFSKHKLKGSGARNNVIEEAFSMMEEDGQIDNLSYGVGKIVKKVLRQELAALYHERVDYEEELKEKIIKEEGNKQEGGTENLKDKSEKLEAGSKEVKNLSDNK